MGGGNTKQAKEAESKLGELFALNDEKDISLKLANLIESNSISEDLLRQLPLEQMGLGEIERRRTALLICSCVGWGLTQGDPTSVYDGGPAHFHEEPRQTDSDLPPHPGSHATSRHGVLQSRGTQFRLRPGI